METSNPCPHKIMILSPAFSVNIVKMSIIHENHGDFFMGIPKSSGRSSPHRCPAALWLSTPGLRQTPKKPPHLAALRDHGWGQHHQSAAHPSVVVFFLGSNDHMCCVDMMIFWESTEIRLEENGWKYDDLLGYERYIMGVYTYMSNLENPRFTERTSTNLGRSHRLPHVCTIMIYGKLGGYRLQETATFIYIYNSQKSTSNLGIANVDITEIQWHNLEKGYR